MKVAKFNSGGGGEYDVCVFSDSNNYSIDGTNGGSCSLTLSAAANDYFVLYFGSGASGTNPSLNHANLSLDRVK
jgi:hypothetical protein